MRHRIPVSLVRNLVLASLTLLTLCASRANAQYTVFTDKNAWIAALSGPFSVENFSDTTLNAGLSITTTTGSISGNKFNDRLEPGQTTTFTFIPPIYAVGGDFNLAPGGPGLGLQFVLQSSGGPVIVTQQIPNTTNGFFGIVSSLQVSALTIQPGTQGGVAETYDLDNLSYANVTAVPEPGEYATAFALFGTTALGMVTARVKARRRKTAAV
jgi:hypothetical protein